MPCLYGYTDKQPSPQQQKKNLKIPINPNSDKKIHNPQSVQTLHATSVQPHPENPKNPQKNQKNKKKSKFRQKNP